MTSPRFSSLVALAGLTLGLLVADTAAAQMPPLPPIPGMPGMPTFPGQQPPPGAQPGYPPPPPGGYPPGQYPPPGAYPPPGGYPPGYVPPRTRPPATGLEMGFLYGTSALWGVGTGIWVDVEAGIEDPGLRLIPPLVIGAAAPLSVFLVDRFAFRYGMPEGLPSAIATGMAVGAGEGLAIAGTQWAIADAEDEWGFRGLARAEVISSTVGAGAGVGLYYLLKPVPQTNLLISSSIVWGTTIGSFFGAGSTTAFAPWGETNDSVAIGGTIGFNAALAAAVTASIWWTPTWNQIGWMWGGMAIGMVASTPVYIFYAASDDDNDPRRGLIFQGVAGAIGLGLGAALSDRRVMGPNFAGREKLDNDNWISIDGASLMPLNSGMGAQVTGRLF